MSFDHLQRRVQRAERAFEARHGQALQHFADARGAWKATWTPTRIVIAGVVAGVVLYAAKPQRLLNLRRWQALLKSAGALSAGLGQLRTLAEPLLDLWRQFGAMAATPAKDAPLPEEPLVDEAFDDAPITAPRPAEAATDVSER